MIVTGLKGVNSDITKPAGGSLRMQIVFVMLLCASVFLSSCTNSDVVSDGNRKICPFVGDWQGDGIDSEGNEFAFAAKVIALGDHKYRILILDKLDTDKEPMHVMDGVLKGNKFTYTADEGKYVGGGKLDDEMFEGYYKGPVDGTYKMQRVID